MSKIKNAKPFKTGNSFCFTIPAAYIKNGEISTEKRYNITIEEVAGADDKAKAC